MWNNRKLLIHIWYKTSLNCDRKPDQWGFHLHGFQVNQVPYFRSQSPSQTQIFQVPRQQFFLSNYVDIHVNKQETLPQDSLILKKSVAKVDYTYKATTWPCKHSTPNQEQWLSIPNSCLQLDKTCSGSLDTFALNFNRANPVQTIQQTSLLFHKLTEMIWYKNLRKFLLPSRLRDKQIVMKLRMKQRKIDSQ